MPHYPDRKVIKLELKADLGTGTMELPAKDVFQAETLVLTTISDAGNITQRALDKRLGPLKLSLPQQRILVLVYYASESLTPSLLAWLLLQERHSVSGLLNRLEDHDLISRRRDGQDRRVIWVELTPKGREIVEEAIDVVLDVARELRPIFDAPNGQVALDLLLEVQNRGSRIVGIREELRQEALRRVWA